MLKRLLKNCTKVKTDVENRRLLQRQRRRRHHTIDAPGHRDHNKNMVTGASQAVNHILVPEGNSSAMAKRVGTEMVRKFDRPESAQDSFTWPLGLASHPERASLSTLGALFFQ